MRNRYPLKAEIERALTSKTAKEWATLFNAHGIPAGEVLTVPEILAHPQVAERGFIKQFEESPGVDRPVVVVRSGFKLASGDPHAAFPPPVLGADTYAILERTRIFGRRGRRPACGQSHLNRPARATTAVSPSTGADGSRVTPQNIGGPVVLCTYRAAGIFEREIKGSTGLGS